MRHATVARWSDHPRRLRRPSSALRRRRVPSDTHDFDRNMILRQRPDYGNPDVNLEIHARGRSMSAATDYVLALYGAPPDVPCPFTDAELEELERTGEILVYVPARITANQMCERWGMKSNVNFDAD